MTGQKIYNFNAGPSILPPEVLEQLGSELLATANKKEALTVLEISHRGKQFDDILCEAEQLLKELLAIPDHYRILFLAGGASQQFALIPLNFMEKTADYLLTGHWSERALEEAQQVAMPRAIYFGQENNYRKLPETKDYAIDDKASYLHLTSNNTIYGTQFQSFPQTSIPLIADMSSDILSRKIEIEQFAVIYACAQKNLGPAGMSLLIVRQDMAEKSYRQLPKIFDYKIQLAHGSRFNTPPVYSIYCALLVLRWLKKLGGVEEIEKRNRKKAKILYRILDNSELYRPRADKNYRSLSNIVFEIKDPRLSEKFIVQAESNGLVGLRGHRILGGIRASIYNAVVLENVKALAQFMQEFEKSC